MQNKIFIKPRKPEFIVFKPNGCRLKAEGEYVDAVPFWQRRINDRDVIAAQPAKSAAAVSSTPKKGK
ncbi:MAG: DUF2635 domain-containing protein [Alphaproteobacteria bacterium]|nr:DUF2635 domain-containing protein [Alphaproteobacteria bacterium]